MTYHLHLSSGILVSGGTYTAGMERVELLNLKDKTSCTLPDLPIRRRFHTSVGGVICGGYGGGEPGISTTCIDVTSGSWSSENYQNIDAVSGHISWNINPGQSFMIIRNDGNRGQIVHTNGTVEDGLTFPYEFGYVFQLFIILHLKFKHIHCIGKILDPVPSL